MSATPTSAGAGVSAPLTEAGVRQIVERVREFGPWRWSLDEGARLQAAPDGFRLASSSAGRDPSIARRVGGWTTFGAAELSVAVARQGDGASRVARADDPDCFVELVDLDVRPVPGVAAGNAVTYGSARPDLHVVQIVNPARFEEVRVLESAAAPASLRLRVRKGPAVREVVVVDDHVEVRGLDGEARILSEPMFAIDARGARRAISIRGRQDEGELVIDGTLDTTGLRYPIAIDPAWTAAAGLSTARFDYGVAVLPSFAYVMGGVGVDGTTMVASAEAYNLATTPAAWTALGIPQLPVARSRAAAVALPAAGTFTEVGMLWLGGVEPNGAGYKMNVGALYSQPNLGGTGRNFVAAGTVGAGRYGMSATLLSDQVTVLVTGGWYDGAEALTTVERWQRSNPTAVLATTPLTTPRFAHRAPLLADGRVLVVGGAKASGRVAPTEIFNPAGTWAAGPSLAVTRLNHTATRLTDGRVLIVGSGGFDSSHTATTEIYTPAAGAAGTLATGPNLASPRGTHGAVLLGNGRVLVAGGMSAYGVHVSTAEVYDPATNKWSPTAPMSTVRSAFELIRPLSGTTPVSYALAIGGRVGNAATSGVDKFDQVALGLACVGGGDCLSGNCVDGVCCNTASCGAGQQCNLATSLGTCSKVLAQACGASSECGSGFCADGVCCNAACAGTCESCKETGAVGTCVPVTGVPRAPRLSCPGTGACQSQCTGVDTPTGRASCGALPVGNLCADAACTTASGVSTATLARACDGSGTCPTGTASSCGGYLCDGKVCKGGCTTATSATDCAPGYGCKGGLCTTTGAAGTACTSDTQCTDGHCVPSQGGVDVCCKVSGCATGSFCGDVSAGAMAGQCVKSLGQSCSASTECGSGYCVDGVCCNKLCGGQCEACDLPGAPGQCNGVNGAPRGGRPACFDGGGDACKALACDGSRDQSKCVGYAKGPETACGAASCAAGKAVEASSCDGFGACKTGSEKNCGNYACDGAACRSSCTTDAHCATGLVCDTATSSCVPPRSKCSADGLTSISPDLITKPCAPFGCNTTTGECFSGCTDSNQCSGGGLCANGVCTPPAAATTQSGGCAVGAAGREGGGGSDRHGAGYAALLALAAATLVARRRATSER